MDVDIKRICRCCATEGPFKHFKTSYVWLDHEEIYSDILKECFEVNLFNSKEDHNNGICEDCIIQLRTSFNFKKQVLVTESMLRKKLDIESDNVKIENENLEILDDPVNIDGLKYEIKLLEELEEIPLKKKKRLLKEKIKKEKKLKSASKKIIITLEEDKRPDVSWVRKKAGEIKFHLRNLHQILKFSNATPIKTTVSVPFNCVYCSKDFQEANLLKSHILNSHDDAKLTYMQEAQLFEYLPKLDITCLNCKLCFDNIVFNKVEDFLEHLKTEHQQKIYTDVKNHILQFIFDSAEHIRCALCRDQYNTLKGLQEHMNKVHYRNYICENCDEGFINRRMLLNHGYRNHSTGLYKCEQCDKTFDTQTKKRTHERCTHVQLNLRWRCPYCQERFNNYHSRRSHFVQVHGHTPTVVKCHACDKIFSNRIVLQRHVKRDHLMERDHKCTECSMTFFMKKQLKDHMVKHTRQKNFKCDICSKLYSRKKSLNVHMKIHTDAQRYSCDDCGQRFTQKYRWKTHMQSKHGK